MIDRRLFIGGTALAAAPLAPAAALDAAEQRLKTDWPWLGRYAEDNKRLIASRTPIDLVFMGDSITEGWRDKSPAFFTPGRINRGIGGQTTPQMLLRMMADVVALRPRYLHLMGGTNDIAGNTGPMTVAQTIDTLTAMCQLARANGIGVLLACVPPAANFPWRPGLDTKQPIDAINGFLRARAATLGATLVAYGPVLSDGAGGMRPGLAYDGVHPTARGYQRMESILEPLLGRLGI
jgi:lysophospholipase L1-like esterase